MTCDRMGKWQMIVEGANTYSPDPARKAQRRRMERHVFRDRGILIATDYLVNAGGVIYAAHERIIPANMKELIQGLCRDGESLPCEVAEKISVRRIASKEKSKTARDVMAPAPVIGLNKQITDAAELLVESHVSIVTVVSEKGRPIGIVTNWDITRATALKLPMDAPLTKIMTTFRGISWPGKPCSACFRQKAEDWGSIVRALSKMLQIG
jgi:glutamate dehydrogenase (NAD(P)+)